MSGQLPGRAAILRRSQAEDEVGLKRATVCQRMQDGPFSSPIRLGGRAAGWRASDIEPFPEDPEDPAGYRTSRPEHGAVPRTGKLWRALRHGGSFPTSDFGAGASQGTTSINTFASGGDSRDDPLYWRGREQGELMGRAIRTINDDIDNQLHTHVRWDVARTGPTITGFDGAGSTQAPYDPPPSVALFLQQIGQQNSFSGGGQQC